MRRDFFLHFLNRDSREIFGLFKFQNGQDHYRLLRQALNAAVLLCEDRCVMPPGFVIEDDIAFGLAESQREYLASSVLQFPMRENNLGDYAEKKRVEYFPMRDRYSGLFSDDRLSFLGRHASGIIRRKSQIGERIIEGWEDGPDTSLRAWQMVKKQLGSVEVEATRKIPTDLADRGIALTWSAIQPELPPMSAEAGTSLRDALQHTYFKLYCQEFNLIVLSSIPYMIEEFYLPSRGVTYTILRSFRNFWTHLVSKDTFWMHLHRHWWS